MPRTRAKRQRRETRGYVPRTLMFGARGGAGRSSVDNVIHRFQRSYLLDELDLDDGTNTEYFAGYEFTLGGLPNATDFTNLFDEYMLTGVKITFIYPMVMVRSSDLTAGTLGAAPVLRYAFDATDASVPANMNAVRQHANSKIVCLGDGKEVHDYNIIYPSNTIYDGASATMVATPDKPIWISTSSATASHYGLKVGVDTQGVATSGSLPPLVIEAKVYFKCRMAR